MKNLISEIQVIPVKANNGLIAFCNFVLFESLYCSSVAIYTRPDGNIRLVYPTKKVGTRELDIFHPIKREIGQFIEKQIAKETEKVMSHDRHHYTSS